MNTPPSSHDRLLITIEEAARALCVGRTKMYSLIASGEVKSVKIGRLRKVSKQELQRFVKNREA